MVWNIPSLVCNMCGLLPQHVYVTTFLVVVWLLLILLLMQLNRVKQDLINLRYCHFLFWKEKYVARKNQFINKIVRKRWRRGWCDEFSSPPFYSTFHTMMADTHTYTSHSKLYTTCHIIFDTCIQNFGEDQEQILLK